MCSILFYCALLSLGLWYTVGQLGNEMGQARLGLSHRSSIARVFGIVEGGVEGDFLYKARCGVR